MSQAVHPNMLCKGHFRERATWQTLPMASLVSSPSPGDRASHPIKPPSGKLPCSAVNRQDGSRDAPLKPTERLSQNSGEVQGEMNKNLTQSP